VLDALITSKTRIKLLLKFFLNANNTDYLRNLESDLGDNTNAIRQELNKLEEANLLNSHLKANRKYFKANTKHPLFKDIHNILLKFTGIDKLIEEVLNKLGNLEEVYLVGDLSKGIDSLIIDLILVGNINKEYLNMLIDKAEKHINKKVRYLYFTSEEFIKEKHKVVSERDLLIWRKV
jgi:predicted transcriptional regulator